MDLETVVHDMKDEKVSAFLKKCIFGESIPTIGDTKITVNLGSCSGTIL